MELYRQRRGETGRIRWTLWLGSSFDDGPFVRVDVGLTGNFRNTALMFNFGGEERDFGVTVGLYWLSMYLALGGVFSHETRRKSYERAEARAAAIGRGMYAYMLDPFEGRDTGVSFHHGSAWVSLWNDHTGWNSGDTPRLAREWVRNEYAVRVRRWRWTRGHLPWNCLGWQWTLDVQDWLIGARQYELSEPLHSAADTYVHMPEGDYPCSITTKKVRWNRRWWNGPWMYRTAVEVPGGVPHPGKGESAWDCGDDATYSVSYAVDPSPPVPLTSYADRFRADVMETRARYAAEPWSPQAGWPSHCIQPPPAPTGPNRQLMESR